MRVVKLAARESHSVDKIHRDFWGKLVFAGTEDVLQ